MKYLCPFASRCAESDYGSLPYCMFHYEGCGLFYKYLKEEIDEYEWFDFGDDI